MLSINPNYESIPRNTIAIKNMKSQRLGKGKRANALGKMLKLSSGPDSFMAGSSIVVPILLQK